MTRHRLFMLTLAVAACADDPLPTASQKEMVPRPPRLATVSVSNVAQLRSAVANAVSGDVIWLADGTYQLDSPIVIQNKTNLYIRGDAPGQAVIKVASGVGYAFSLGANLDTLDFGHFTIEGTLPLTINSHAIGSNHNRSTLKNVTIQDMEIKDISVGISVVGATSTSCSGIDIYNNTLTNIQDWPHLDVGAYVTSGSGYGIHTANCTNVQIFDNSITNADRHSIYVAATPADVSAPNVKVEQNLIVNHGQSPSSGFSSTNFVALVVARSRGVSVANNVIVNPYNTALSIERAYENSPVPNPENISLIANTVLGSRTYDVLLETSGYTNTLWGNRFVHLNESDVDSVPSYQPNPSGSLVQPSTWAPTQAVSLAPRSYSTGFVMQNGWLHKVTPDYSNHPNSWSYTHNSGSPTLSNFQALEAGNNRAYVMANNTLREFNPSGWTYSTSGTNWSGFQAMAYHYADGRLYVIQSNYIHRVNPADWSYSYDGDRWTSTRILVSYGSKLYVMRGNCIESVIPSTFSATSISGC